MKRAVRWALLAGALCAIPVIAVGCGSSSDDNAGGGTGEGKKGGKVTYLAAADVDYVDPGQTFYTFGYAVAYATNRPLYSFTPSDAANAVPDLAAGPADIAADGKSVTVKIRSGVKFGPPVNREVTSADVKYAFERAYSKNVPSQYASAYFTDIVGSPDVDKIGTGPITPVSGIETPDPTTIVFRLKNASGPIFAQKLVMPITMPVPEEYAKPFDAKVPSTYDQYAVSSGPYMIKNDANGKLVGRVPGKQIILIRNPNWDPATDHKPAYLDEIDISEGNDDQTIAAKRTLSGQSLVCCDSGSPPAEVLKDALQNNKDQVEFIASGGTRYIAMNTTVPPFDNLNVRKAIIAASNRNALRQTRGGAVLGDIAQGYIPPGVPGFEESGGLEANKDLDFMANPAGDPAVARKYMDAAAAEGLPIKDGKWTGGERLLTIATNADPGKRTAEVFQGQIEALGFKLNFRLVPQDALYTKFCNVPSQNVAICPNVGFFKDFADPQGVLDTTFNGDKILPAGNSNWPELNVPEINQAFAAASLLPIGPERAKAYAAINRQIVEQAPAIPWLWDKTAIIQSKNVVPAPNGYHTNHDLTYLSLK